LTRPELASSNHAALKVRELVTILAGFTSARQREIEATGNLNAALMQRDEISDLYQHAPCGYHSLDAEGRLVRMNETALNWLGYGWQEVQGRHFTELLTPAGRVTFAENFPRFIAAGHIENLELELVRKDGSTLPVGITATAVYDPDGRFLCSRSTSFDLTERKRLESRLDQLARTDALTGLSNRRDFYDQASRELQRCERTHKTMALLILDIDHFKQVNDTHGHQGGDRVLQAIANTCKAILRKIDIVARIGGEEFAAMLPETTLELALEIADRMRLAIAGLVTELAPGEKVRVTASIGVARYEPTDVDLDRLMARADAALYASKHAGRDRVSVAGDGAAAHAIRPGLPDFGSGGTRQPACGARLPDQDDNGHDASDMRLESGEE
jgi:diguanylate cyclase (GGDEF)-like protein/PAS domain S-box-containing protein